MTTNIYVPKAFFYITLNQVKIRKFALRINVAPAAVAAFIAK